MRPKHLAPRPPRARRLALFAVAITALLAAGLGGNAAASGWRYFSPSAGSAPTAAIAVDSQYKSAGSTVRLHGTGWQSDEVVELRLAPTFSSVRASASGEWWKTIAVPNVSPRTIPLQGVGTRSRAITDLPIIVTAPATTSTTTSSTTTPTTQTPTTSTTIGTPSRPVALGESRFAETLPGQLLWQPISWVGGTDRACDFEVTVPDTQGFGVEYSSARSYAGPPESRDIEIGEATYTAVKLRAPGNASADRPLTVNASYTPCDAAGRPTGAPVALVEQVTIPIDPKAEGLVQETIEVGPYPAGTIGEANVYFTAYGPVENMRVRVTDKAGTEIYYPQERDYTTPSKVEGIEPGESDYVGFRIDVGALTPGLKVLTLEVSYGNGMEKTTSLAVNVV